MSYRDLVAWQKAMVLVTDTYRATSKFPKDEQFGLTSQLRRCSVRYRFQATSQKGKGGSLKKNSDTFLARREAH
jgi:hypothetical protein